MTKPTFLSIIPARGGSKGLPGKNIIDLYGKPLIAWTIEASLDCDYVTKTIVSSEDDKILAVAEQYGAQTRVRPVELAEDTTPTEPVICDVLETLEARGESYDYILLLQVTSPLRHSSDIDAAISKLLAAEATALISVSEPEHTPLKAFTLNEQGFLKGLFGDKFPFMRRQDLPVTFLPNGAIYIIKTSDYLQSKTLFTDKTIHYEMPLAQSVDIDTLADLKTAEEYLKCEN